PAGTVTCCAEPTSMRVIAQLPISGGTSPDLVPSPCTAIKTVMPIVTSAPAISAPVATAARRRTAEPMGMIEVFTRRSPPDTVLRANPNAERPYEGTSLNALSRRGLGATDEANRWARQVRHRSD